jgi:non-heme chloroperoxidase
VVRYLGAHGTTRVAKVVMIGTVPPLLMKTIDNPLGIEPQVFDSIRTATASNRCTYLEQFFNDAHNVEALGGPR